VKPITVAVLTVSDRCARGEAQDASGSAVAELVQRALGAQVVAKACVPDEAPTISAQIKAWARGDVQPDLILTTGGTGLSPRDVTPEATLAVLERRHPGLLELARLRCYATTPRAYLSRGEAGTLGRSLVINLPGAPRGATEQLEALLDVLPHAIAMLRGETRGHDTVAS
jgi:molybdopterin adenylyltransferase